MVGSAPVQAIMSGAESFLAPSRDRDYALGKAAFAREDWSAVIGHMTQVLARRPWHDNALAMVGYAWRKLGRYDDSLAAYGEALTLNPRNRAALSYLGEAYLDLGRDDDARATALQLAEVCNLVVMAFDNRGWKSGCEELEVLEAAFVRKGVALRVTN